MLVWLIVSLHSRYWPVCSLGLYLVSYRRDVVYSLVPSSLLWVCTKLYGTSTVLSTPIFLTLFLHSLFRFRHAGVQRQLLIRKSVTGRQPSRVHRHPRHIRWDDVAGWFGYHCAGTHWDILVSTGYDFEGFFWWVYLIIQWPKSRAIMYRLLTSEVVFLSQHIWESGCGVGLAVVASIRAQ